MNGTFEEKLDWLRSVVADGPRRPLFATVSGAHLYGFESADSDWDLRGAFVAPLADVLRMQPAEETVSILGTRDGVELDWVAHDVLKFARLMTKRNGYVLEQIESPLVVHGGGWHDELRELGQGCVVRNLHHHYAGFAANQVALLDGGDETVKRLLYCYRVLLTGIHVLSTGCVESNVVDLAAEHGVDVVPELVERKRSGAEHGRLVPGEAAAHRERLASLRERLEHAFERSALPDEPTSLDALDDFVVRARLELGRG